MRVTGGTARGRTLVGPPRGALARPTSDKVRQAIFNIVGPRVVDASVLDLFAGTGAMAIEALARGARGATAVEHDAAMCAIIRRNLAALGFAERVRVMQRDVRRIGRAPAGAPFDLVFIDPPYALGLEWTALEVLANDGWLTDHALVFVERAHRDVCDMPPSLAARWQLTRAWHYGETDVTCYTRIPTVREDPR